jgi:ADP-heptose synthase, bifunctional sugar kinase/adenylyltransferase
MDAWRFKAITSAYSSLSIAVLGDFCLDRYLEIDVSRQEVSIETGLPVHNVAQVRALPGGAGTIVNNLSALGIRKIYPIGLVGEDGEGYELCRALGQRPGVTTDAIVRTSQRRTFTYCKPMLCHRGGNQEELNRFDIKNWTPTPALLQGLIIGKLEEIAAQVDGIIILDQVNVPETGVVTRMVLDRIKRLAKEDSDLVVIADSRRSLRDFPPVIFKMNAAELRNLVGAKKELSFGDVGRTAAELALQNRRSVFVTLAEKGIVGTSADGHYGHVPALPLRGKIDIVGAGDAVSANLATAIAAGASLNETLELANAAASVVIHKLGTTGTATVGEIEKLLLPES